MKKLSCFFFVLKIYIFKYISTMTDQRHELEILCGLVEDDTKEQDPLHVVFHYGKYKNRTIGEVIECDVKYIIWFKKNSTSDFMKEQIQKAAELLLPPPLVRQ